MATYTTNYGLHQWEASDDFLRTDFNTDFAKIDAAVKGVSDTIPGLILGSYTGDGASSKVITLGFQPKAVLLFRRGVEAANDRYALMASPGFPCLSNRDNVKMLEITEQGFKVIYSTYDAGNYYADHLPVTNESGAEYRYLAIQ